MLPFPARGLYAITQPENKTIAMVLAEVEAAIKGGAAIIQYRDKNPADAVNNAGTLAQLCHRYRVPFIINDDIELARQVEADGVHIGKTDGALESARKRLGRNAIIGVSCYNSVGRALEAQESGATYVAFGRFFPSATKPSAPPADISTLTDARQAIRIPIVAIGGILPENGGRLLAAGADVLAVIGGIFDRDPEQSARAFQHLFRS
jgi:thiamine-phosphate pyrophosphorylase